MNLVSEIANFLKLNTTSPDNNNQPIYMVFNEGRIGDVIVSIPLCKEIKKYYPDSKLLFVCTPYTKDIVEQVPEIDEVIIFDKKNAHKGILGTLKFIKEFKYFGKVDYCFTVHRYNRGILLPFLFRAKHRISDYHYSRCYKFLLTDYMYKNESDRPQYIVDRYSNYINFSKNNYELIRDMSFNIDEESDIKAKNFIKDKTTKATVGIFFNNYFEANAVNEFIVQLNEYGYMPILFGSSSDVNFSKELKSVSNSEYIDLIGKTSLKELCAFIKNIDFIVTVDTGSMHISAALNKPNIVLTCKHLYDIWVHKDKCKVIISNDRDNPYSDISLKEVAIEVNKNMLELLNTTNDISKQ